MVADHEGDVDIDLTASLAQEQIVEAMVELADHDSYFLSGGGVLDAPMHSVLVCDHLPRFWKVIVREAHVAGIEFQTHAKSAVSPGRYAGQPQAHSRRVGRGIQ